MAQTKTTVRPSAHLAELAKALRHASHVHHTATPEAKTAAEVQLYAAAIQYGDEFRRLERCARRKRIQEAARKGRESASRT